MGVPRLLRIIQLCYPLKFSLSLRLSFFSFYPLVSSSFFPLVAPSCARLRFFDILCIYFSYIFVFFCLFSPHSASHPREISAIFLSARNADMYLRGSARWNATLSSCQLTNIPRAANAYSPNAHIHIREREIER